MLVAHALILPLAVVVWASMGPLDGVVAGLQPDPTADYGLIVEDLASGQRTSLNESRQFASGSVYKLPLAWEVLRQVDLGRLQLDQTILVTDADTSEVEPEGGLAANDTPTVREALRAMFTVSSNASAHALLRVIGRREFNEAMDDVGLWQTRVPDEPDVGDAMTSPDDVARLLRRIAAGQDLSPASQSELRLLLTQGGMPDALRETLADDVSVLDKTGNLENASNVAALLSTPRGEVLLVVLDQGVDPGDARGIIAQLAQAAYTAYLE